MQDVVDSMELTAPTANIETTTLMTYWAKSRKGKSSRTTPRANTARYARSLELYLRKIESHRYAVQRKGEVVTKVVATTYQPLRSYVGTRIGALSNAHAIRLSKTLANTMWFLSFQTGNIKSLPAEKDGYLSIPSVGVFSSNENEHESESVFIRDIFSACAYFSGLPESDRYFQKAVVSALHTQMLSIDSSNSTCEARSTSFDSPSSSSSSSASSAGPFSQSFQGQSPNMEPFNNTYSSSNSTRSCASSFFGSESSALVQERPSNTTPSRLWVAYHLSHLIFNDAVNANEAVVLCIELVIYEDPNACGDHRPTCIVERIGFANEAGLFVSEHPNDQLQYNVENIVSSSLRIKSPISSWSFLDNEIYKESDDDDYLWLMEHKRLTLQYAGSMFIDQIKSDKNCCRILVLLLLDDTAENVQCGP